MRREMRRYHTEPAPIKLVKPALSRSVSGQVPLVPPDTDGVRQQLLADGPSTTLLDVAKGIIDRLLENPELEVEETLFLKDCIGASLETLAMPCSLLQRDTGDGTPGGYDYLFSIYAKQVQPSSSCPGTPGSRSRTPSVAFRQPNWDSIDSKMLTAFDLWDFDSFELSEATRGHPLRFAAWRALDGFLSDETEIFLDMDKTSRFLEAAEEMYAKADTVLYHNNVHAADVTQCVHALLVQFGFAAFFDQLSILALLLGAAVHDMGHDGRTNSYHVNVGDDIAYTYNDISVLENMHISKAFKLMRTDPSANILDGFKHDHRTRLRKEMVEVVLGTDMSSHFGNVADFKTLVEKLGNETREWHEEKAMSALRVMVLHAMDISNPAKVLDLSDKWSDLLRQEFFLQGDQERQLGLPISPLCDRDTVRFASSQVGFFTIIVQPTFALLAELQHRVKDRLLVHLRKNTEAWEARKKAESPGTQYYSSKVAPGPYS
ncbi:Pde1c [Symbiodinium pilosum]|uniref:Phosphodiesterase n=1 Tax=Symbiodinium pilosum TaxID=2952 RepID=A0A812V0L7_SYMPI|nr:Pde1c [Symbiodinium pilosum]